MVNPSSSLRMICCDCRLKCFLLYITLLSLSVSSILSLIPLGFDLCFFFLLGLELPSSTGMEI